MKKKPTSDWYQVLRNAPNWVLIAYLIALTASVILILYVTSLNPDLPENMEVTPHIVSALIVIAIVLLIIELRRRQALQ